MWLQTPTTIFLCTASVKDVWFALKQVGV